MNLKYEFRLKNELIYLITDQISITNESSMLSTLYILIFFFFSLSLSSNNLILFKRIWGELFELENTKNTKVIKHPST